MHKTAIPTRKINKFEQRNGIEIWQNASYAIREKAKENALATMDLYVVCVVVNRGHLINVMDALISKMRK
jgi:hypothetical protein